MVDPTESKGRLWLRKSGQNRDHYVLAIVGRQGPEGWTEIDGGRRETKMEEDQEGGNGRGRISEGEEEDKQGEMEGT